MHSRSTSARLTSLPSTSSAHLAETRWHLLRVDSIEWLEGRGGAEGRNEGREEGGFNSWRRCNPLAACRFPLSDLREQWIDSRLGHVQHPSHESKARSPSESFNPICRIPFPPTTPQTVHHGLHDRRREEVPAIRRCLCLATAHMRNPTDGWLARSASTSPTASFAAGSMARKSMMTISNQSCNARARRAWQR